MDKYLDFKDAVASSLGIAEVTTLEETVHIGDSIGRVLAQKVICVKNLPSFNNSAMDGFAIKATDAGKRLKVLKTILAGDSVEATLSAGECYKIMTGAKVPSDADTIIPIEDVLDYENSEVTIKENVVKNSCLRFKGEEKALGDVLFDKGEVITSGMVALLASQGITMLSLYKKLNIAVVSTGNELKEPWEIASDDEIYNCNSYAIISLLKEKGFNATYTGVVPDSLEKSVEFVNGLKSYDLIITTGGISMGDADYMAEAFERNGLEIAFHGVNIKPGRPIMMGKMDNTFVMCLPGNPLTAMVNMHLFAFPVLNKLQGSLKVFHDVDIATNVKAFKTKSGRVNVVLGSYADGKYCVTQNNKYGSGMISVIDASNCILVTDESCESISEEDSVKIIKFNCLYSKDQIDLFN
ncbi:molybdopterin biosynthesis protein MoeA [Sulfurimonas gotlandica GD1]|jgi:molybdopterin molybdotransferase|uniref:Molybdopterin molybdenumtransferase n=1 Tax=Sulfurimonas gotlandica (strain DSM 19862 / JCM 16533 / GD1) TaxID=929558 RepID=B6BLJ7_SULGG|nr:molybdopterin molybdotransferase MoeA [Sulfurimonas gotlandica]EDZ62213.1 moea protein [Sulfurimonas gotlandica GD1]EHP28654.1 molybdopterin biosynthesis protein MoeA [Sulfurimonas gotlandica GD1]